MAAGSSTTNLPNHKYTPNWAEHLRDIGILQNGGPSTSNRRPRSHLHQLLISTPLDPAVVPAEDLNVYWEHSSK